MDNKGQIEELVVCRLNTRPDDTAYKAALEDTNRWLAAQPGFQWRVSGYTDDGRLVDRCGWASTLDAQTAGARFMDSDAGKAFGAFLDPDGMVMAHYRLAERA